jgi:hypothetical protein
LITVLPSGGDVSRVAPGPVMVLFWTVTLKYWPGLQAPLHPNAVFHAHVPPSFYIQRYYQNK